LYDARHLLRTKKIPLKRAPLLGHRKKKRLPQPRATLPAPRASVYYAKSRKRSAVAIEIGAFSLSGDRRSNFPDFSKEAFSSEK
jgi:hypothetical protein